MIPIIEVGRNSIVIRNVDMESQNFKNFNYNFAVWDHVTHKYTMTAYTVLGKDIYIPATVGVGQVTRHFREKEVQFNMKTTAQSQELNMKMTSFPRSDLQRNAIKFLGEMKDDYKQRHRFLSLPTGEGKTFTSIHMASVFKKKTLIILDTLELARQ